MARRLPYEIEQGDADLPEDWRPRKRRKRPEDILQKSCIAWLRKLRRSSGGRVRFIVAQPEKRRTLWQQQNDKARGMEPGSPELLIYDARSRPRHILVELKDPVNGRMSDAQTEWRNFCFAAGFEHYIITTLDELQRAVG